MRYLSKQTDYTRVGISRFDHVYDQFDAHHMETILKSILYRSVVSNKKNITEVL